jgi:uncharacterized RmlC-like cupin family protein
VTEEIRIVPNGALESGPSTGGMTRKTAVAGDDVWMGEVRTEPGAMSGWHHHGEHTTYGYVIAGRVRVEFGPDGSQSLEGGNGDFFVVPAHTVHREGNPGSEEQVLVAVRLGSGPSVINVEGPPASGN